MKGPLHSERKRWLTTPGPRVAAGLCAAAVAGVLLLAACDGGGGAAVLEGAATIRGVVVSFEGEQAYFVPRPRPKGLVRVISSLAEFFVPSAYAAVEGVAVSVARTDLVGTTADDGLFVLSGVPPGRRQLQFRRGADLGTLDLDVPPKSNIDLGDVRVSNGEARPSRVDIEIDEDDDGGTRSEGEDEKNPNDGREDGGDNSKSD